jgi:hypothetical protein
MSPQVRHRFARPPIHSPIEDRIRGVQERSVREDPFTASAGAGIIARFDAQDDREAAAFGARIDGGPELDPRGVVLLVTLPPARVHLQIVHSAVEPIAQGIALRADRLRVDETNGTYPQSQ